MANVQNMRERGWIGTGDPVQLPSGNWVMREVRVITYDLGKRKNVDRHFTSIEQAYEWLAEAGSKLYNLYRNPGGQNGCWRTDW